nr:inorganic phosphate transporter [Legionella tunisiensis]
MVAQMIGSGLIDTTIVDAPFILAALVGAIFWNLVTWYYGLPSSSSHALIGGLAGAALAKAGISALKLSGFVKVAIGILFLQQSDYLLVFSYLSL